MFIIILFPSTDQLREKLLSMNIGGMEENVREIIFHTEDNVDQIQTLFNLVIND